MNAGIEGEGAASAVWLCYTSEPQRRPHFTLRPGIRPSL